MTPEPCSTYTVQKPTAGPVQGDSKPTLLPRTGISTGSHSEIGKGVKKPNDPPAKASETKMLRVALGTEAES